ncbi:MAG: hypothetical protein IJN49_01265 [Clostridia bacterium]|nr:hypothetical protein [Clostridia bacterium]
MKKDSIDSLFNTVFKAIFVGFIESIGLLVTVQIAVCLLNISFLPYSSLIVATVITVILAFFYSKLLQKIKSKREVTIFSLMSIFSLIDFYFLWCALDLYIPFDVLPGNKLDASGNIGIILLLIWFVISYLITRLVVLVKFIKNNPNLKR